jgi:hypothetical protein
MLCDRRKIAAAGMWQIAALVAKCSSAVRHRLDVAFGRTAVTADGPPAKAGPDNRKELQ